MTPVSRGFRPRPISAERALRLPPGQYETGDFPVLSLGPTPRGAARDWSLSVTGAAAPRRLDWEGLLALPGETITADIHCVTHWSKLGTTWTGVPLDALVEPAAGATHLLAHCEGGYTTDLPLAAAPRLATGGGGSPTAPPPAAGLGGGAWLPYA